jgi:hypothetical protein
VSAARSSGLGGPPAGGRDDRSGGSGTPPVPLERPRATGLLTGLAMFAGGFAVAGVLVMTGTSGTPAYYVAVTVGMVGVGVVGFFLNRGTVPLPPKPIWSPVGIGVLARTLGFPQLALLGTLYGLGAIGVLGNVVVPMLLRR